MSTLVKIIDFIIGLILFFLFTSIIIILPVLIPDMLANTKGINIIFLIFPLIGYMSSIIGLYTLITRPKSVINFIKDLARTSETYDE